MVHPIKGDFYNKCIVSVDQFDKEDILAVFKQASDLKHRHEKGEVFKDLEGKLLTALFYEPSSRTFGSFIAAMARLGGKVIPIQGVSFSSVVKGESLEDTIRTFASYSDVIAIRHSEEGAANKAANISSIPIINAGDGIGEHPTQALLDLFTINDRLGRMESLHVAMVGDLKYGRTVHSLSKLLSLFPDITVSFVAPVASPMPAEIVELITKRGVKVSQHSKIDEVLVDADVLYMTRIQKERMDEKTYEGMKGAFVLTGELASKMKTDSIIMHPLPRVGEITIDVDENPRAVYLKHQMRNGMFVRMALLKLVLTK
jgi:aspartate carbamoyltransferase catalytic subunit